MKNSFLKSLIYKIPVIRAFVDRINKMERRFDRDVTELRMSLVNAQCSDFRSETNYILQNLDDTYEWFIPYPKMKDVDTVESGIDRDNGMPYVVHKGKRLYFPKTYELKKCISDYESYIGREALLGGNYRIKQPHQYQSDRCKIEEGDVLVDVGCAEAIMALDNIDRIGKAYLIEGESMWLPALKATFDSYQEKIVIINKFVSDKDSDTTITLSSALQEEDGESVFIKMDIEGSEVDVMKCSADYLTSREKTKLTVCTYHRQNDADYISKMLAAMGYQQEFSDGYMYIHNGLNPVYPYFRHGLIRGWK